jgi:hypothetical protein
MQHATLSKCVVRVAAFPAAAAALIQVLLQDPFAAASPYPPIAASPPFVAAATDAQLSPQPSPPPEPVVQQAC